MTLEELRREHKEAILAIAAKYGITNIRVFGSVARGEATQESDVDLLVHLTKPLGFKYARVQREVTEVLDIPAQVIADDGLNPLIREHILQEAVPL